MNTAAIISSQQEILEQCQRFISSVTEEQYRAALEPHFSSSPGKHIRHVIDHYLALKAGCSSGIVDYNKRNRDTCVEHDPKSALDIAGEISRWLSSLTQEQLRLPMEVISEISVSEELHLTCQSSLIRELVFVGSHAVHHYSLIAAILSVQGNPQTSDFGIAPATLTFQREQKRRTG